VTSQVFLSRLALRDLDEIWYYVAQDNLAAADRLVADIRDKFHLLGAHPALGESRVDLPTSGYRSFTAGRYVIFYRLSRDAVVIARVLHGARDHGRLL